MPPIQWQDLPPAIRDHLFARLRERKITAEDLYALKLWRESEPVAPDGRWYKDFGSFKICGEGQYPKAFLLQGQPAKARGCSGARRPLGAPTGHFALRPPRNRLGGARRSPVGLRAALGRKGQAS